MSEAELGNIPASPSDMDEGATSQAGELARHSLSVAKWTMVSRVTGFARAAVIAAVLGPTYLGNTFQATNYLPNIIFEFLTGSLLVTLLVPVLVGHIDERSPQDVARVASGFLGATLAGLLAVTCVVVAAGPLVVRLLAIQATGAGVEVAQQRVGLIFLVLLIPQVMLYGIAGTGAAVMNAYGRYALASAAPALENFGVMATMAAVAVIFGMGADVRSVDTAEVILLGAGTTAAVACHAAAQWWGASRLGVRLVPSRGWRDPRIRQLLRRMFGSLGYAGLNGVRQLGLTVVANGVSGGVVAFSLALNFYWLPTRVGARAVYLTQLPALSRLHHAHSLRRFRDELVLGANRAYFLTVPVALGYLVLAFPLAHAVAFGQFAEHSGVQLLALALTGLAIGVLGDSGFLLGTYGAYARQDVRAPFAGMVVRLGVSMLGMVAAAAFFQGDLVVLMLGAAVAAGDVLSAIYLGRRVAHELPAPGERLAPAFLRAVLGSVIMIVPTYLIEEGLSRWIGGGLHDQLAILISAPVGAAIYVAAQSRLRSPELVFFGRVLPWRSQRSG